MTSFLHFFRKRKPITLPTSPCDICLIVHDKVLLHAHQSNLIAQPEESLLDYTPTEIASAARRLLPNTSKQKRIALALPNHEFIATTLQLPQVEPQNLKNAVSLQLPTLLPGNQQPLLLAVQQDLKHNPDTVALWMSAKFAEELYQAFVKEGLFLAAILPRVLMPLPNKTPLTQIYDEDAQTITCVEWRGNTIHQWLYLPRQDVELKEFVSQWNEHCQHLAKEATHIQKSRAEEWRDVPMPLPLIYGYSFVPPGTILLLNQQRKRQLQRRMWWAAGISLFIILLAIGWVIRYEYRLERKLQRMQERTASINQLRITVLKTEEEFAPITEFPQQRIEFILETLNRLIPAGSWLTNLRLESGKIEIEGLSPDPTNILKILSAETQFQNVGFSTPVTSVAGQAEERFGISFTLAGVDMPAYWLKHFPEK